MISVLVTQGFYLHDLHIDYIKIGSQFVVRVNADPESTRILIRYWICVNFRSVSSLKVSKRKNNLTIWNQNNITFQQGYYFYKPVTYIDLVKIILSKPKVKVVVEGKLISKAMVRCNYRQLISCCLLLLLFILCLL